MFISFSNGNGSAFENSLDSGRISIRKRPGAMYSAFSFFFQNFVWF